MPISNYQHPTSIDHRTAMHRQQNPPNVLIIELGELVGLGRNSNEGEVTVGIQRYRDCTEFLWFAGDLSDWMGDLDTDISVPFSSSFLCVSLVTTAIHDNVMPLRTYPTSLLSSFDHTSHLTLHLWSYASCRHTSDIGPDWGSLRPLRILALVACCRI